MSSENIGKIIQELRKEKNIKQETLGEAIGVSAQAVSKWENGGTPDIELLPAIADFFGVTIDSLFRKNVKNYDYIENTVTEYIMSLDNSEKYPALNNLFWNMEKAIYGESTTSSYAMKCNYNNLATLSLLRNQQYAFLMINPDECLKIIPSAETYQNLFMDLSNIDFLNALFFFLMKNDYKDFTKKLLIKNLNISEEKAKELIKLLLKYKILTSKEIEIDEKATTLYLLRNRISIIPLLLFAKEML